MTRSIIITVGSLFLILLTAVTFAEDKVYTNDDLKPEPARASTLLEPVIKSSRHNTKTIDYQDLMKRSHQGSPDVNKRLTGPVVMKISKCQTLQEGLDDKKGSIGDTVLEVNGKGRTVEEICETLGQGCQYCSLATQ
jgi:hypothetical protein